MDGELARYLKLFVVSKPQFKQIIAGLERQQGLQRSVLKVHLMPDLSALQILFKTCKELIHRSRIEGEWDIYGP